MNNTSDDFIRADAAEDEREQERRAREIEETIKTADSKKRAEEEAAGTALDSKLSHVLDAVTSCMDAVTGMGKRMDAIDASEKDRKDAASKKDAVAEQPKETGEDDDSFDELPETEREQMIAEEIKRAPEEGREPFAAREVAADAARKRYDDAVKRESRYDRERRVAHLRVATQSRADEVFNSLGMTAPPPLSSEGVRGYRRRLLKQVQRYSPAYKNIDLANISDAKVFAVAESQILADAYREGVRPTDFGPGRLREIRKKGPGGHQISEFVGEPRVWMDQFAGPVQLRGVGAFLVPGSYRGN